MRLPNLHGREQWLMSSKFTWVGGFHPFALVFSSHPFQHGGKTFCPNLNSHPFPFPLAIFTFCPLAVSFTVKKTLYPRLSPFPLSVLLRFSGLCFFSIALELFTIKRKYVRKILPSSLSVILSNLQGILRHAFWIPMSRGKWSYPLYPASVVTISVFLWLYKFSPFSNSYIIYLYSHYWFTYLFLVVMVPLVSLFRVSFHLWQSM